MGKHSNIFEFYGIPIYLTKMYYNTQHNIFEINIDHIIIKSQIKKNNNVKL